MNNEKYDQRSAETLALMDLIGPQLHGYPTGVVLLGLTNLLAMTLSTLDMPTRELMIDTIPQALRDIATTTDATQHELRANGAATPRKPPARTS